jgi:hypothetical protein
LRRRARRGRAVGGLVVWDIALALELVFWIAFVGGLLTLLTAIA